MKTTVIASLFFLVSYIQCSQQSPQPVQMGEKVMFFTQDTVCNQVNRVGYGSSSVFCYVGCCVSTSCEVACDVCCENQDARRMCEKCRRFCWDKGGLYWKYATRGLQNVSK